ncbi:MAG: glycosyltransferase [Patescibacteria group bacterium]
MSQATLVNELGSKSVTAEVTFSLWQKLAIVVTLLIVACFVWLGWLQFLVGAFATITVFYFLVVAFKSALTYHSLSSGLVTFEEGAVAGLDGTALPTYTILVPLYKESEVLEQLVCSLSGLDYPVQKLQILLLLEECDSETIRAAKGMDLPTFFEMVIVPKGYPQTKPRACNYGLQRARGELVVIFDAEDVPDSDELKKAVLAFSQVDDDVMCVQARLEYFNPETNWLTRLFSAEYVNYFSLVLPGLGKLGLPVPLGGTSNHFQTDDLRKIGGSDSHNVTEDIDLGMWIARCGGRVVLMDAVTLEEANSRLWNWIRQRSRWVKGYIQTYLVHMRKPLSLLNDLGLVNFIAFQVIVLGTPLTLLVNPILWATTIVYAVTGWGFIELLYPPPVFALALINMVIGNFLFVYYIMTGCMVREMYANVKWAFLSPVYWCLMSFAAWKAVIQLVHNPHYWEKTKHYLVSAPVRSRFPDS